MPMQRHLYPSNWDEIAFVIKHQAQWTCQQCHKVCRKPGETKEEFTKRLGYSGNIEKLGRYTLTVAHINHIASDCRVENLRAWCSSCHGTYDLKQMSLKKYLKRERHGQLRLNLDLR